MLQNFSEYLVEVPWFLSQFILMMQCLRNVGNAIPVKTSSAWNPSYLKASKKYCGIQRHI